MTASTEDGAIRLGGLASGFDTESIVESLLAPDKQRLEKLEETKQINIAKIQTWEDVSEQLRTLSEIATKLKADGTAGSTLFDDKLTTSSNATVVTAVADPTSSSGNYDINVANTARAQVIYGNQKPAGFTVSAGSFTINGVVVTVNAGQTLKQVASTINSVAFPAGQNVEANVIDNRMVLQTTDTGASQVIYGSVAGAPPFTLPGDDPTSILQTELELIDGGGNFSNVAQTAADASLTINGVPLTTDQNLVDDAILGVTFTLFSAGSSNINITHDTKKIKDTITDLVDIYNESRNLIKRVREVKLDEEDDFGLFASDSLMRSIYSELRGLTTGGVRLVSGEWDGAPTSTAAVADANGLTINGLTGTTSLKAGDYFSIAGHPKGYRLTVDAPIAAGSATVAFEPPLFQSVVLGETVTPQIRTMNDFGVGVRSDTVSATEGVLAVLDEARLDSALATEIDSVKALFSRNDTNASRLGLGRRLYDWIDEQIKISVFASKTRSIEDIAIPGLENRNDGIDDQVERLQDRIDQQRRSLIRRFADMENSIQESQSLGASIGQINGSGGAQQ